MRVEEFPEGSLYTIQCNAWMDESVMLQWVDQVLKPWSETVPDKYCSIPTSGFI